jgi:hypothetical protein
MRHRTGTGVVRRGRERRAAKPLCVRSGWPSALPMYAHAEWRLARQLLSNALVWVCECPSPKVGTERSFPGKGIPSGNDGAPYTKLGDPK